MSTPALKVLLAFGQPPLTTNGSAVWTDVSAFVSGNDEHHIRRGRNHERDEFEAGTAIITLTNTDRRFDPDNTSAPAPYLGNIEPMTKIRIGALMAGDVTPTWLFTGYVESWQPDYPGGNVSTCTLECVDAFKLYGMIVITTAGNRPPEQTDARILAVLEALGWWSDRAISAGDGAVAEMPLDATALAIMQQTAATERGQFYMDAWGTATFEAGSFRATLPSFGTWGDAADGSELPYSDLDTRYDDSTIWNQVYATRPGGIQQAAFNSSSQTDYFVRTQYLTALPWADDTAAWDAARRMVARYAYPHTRPERLTIDPGVRNTWASVLPREISHRITIRRRTLNGGPMLSLDAHIEAVDWHITKGLWICTWQLSPVFTPGPASGTLNTTPDWKTVPFENGWADFGGIFTPVGFRKEGEWVYLRGRATGGLLNQTILTLPVGYRPPGPVRIAVDANGAFGVVLVQSDGRVSLGAASNVSVYLDPVQFRVI